MVGRIRFYELQSKEVRCINPSAMCTNAINIGISNVMLKHVVVKDSCSRPGTT